MNYGMIVAARVILGAGVGLEGGLLAIVTALALEESWIEAWVAAKATSCKSSVSQCLRHEITSVGSSH